MINLHQLRIFVVVVGLRSVTRAAQQVHLTQPAVTGQLRHLRTFVGAPILRREGRQVVPTQDGWALFEYAQRVLGETESLQRELAEVHSGELGDVVVAGNRAYGTYVLPGVLSQFHAKHPSVKITLRDAPSEEVLERVGHGEIDVAVVAQLRVPKELVVDHLGDDATLIIESARHAVSDGGALSLEQVSEVPFVRTLMGRNPAGAKLDHVLVAAGLKARRVVMELTTWEGVKEAVRCGVGLAFAFQAVVARELASGEFRTVVVPGYEETRPVDLICAPQHVQRQPAPAFLELLDVMREEIPQHLTSGRDRSV